MVFFCSVASALVLATDSLLRRVFYDDCMIKKKSRVGEAIVRVNDCEGYIGVRERARRE
jgi:hypothetical protein